MTVQLDESKDKQLFDLHIHTHAYIHDHNPLWGDQKHLPLIPEQLPVIRMFDLLFVRYSKAQQLN